MSPAAACCPGRILVFLLQKSPLGRQGGTAVLSDSLSPCSFQSGGTRCSRPGVSRLFTAKPVLLLGARSPQGALLTLLSHSTRSWPRAVLTRSCPPP